MSKDVYSSTDTAYQLGYQRGKNERIEVVYYDVDDLNPAALERLYTLQAENIDNLIYLPKGSALKTFNITQLRQVRDQFVNYINYLIGEKFHENLEG